MEERTEITARGIITVGTYVLLAKGKNDSFMHLPGGHVEAGEDPAGALGRELKEELGRDFSFMEYLGQLENIFDKGNTRIHEQLHLYKVKLYPYLQEVPPRSEEDWLLFEWVPITDLEKVNLLPPVLHDYVRQVGGA